MNTAHYIHINTIHDYIYTYKYCTWLCIYINTVQNYTYVGILGPFPSSVLAAGKETIKYFTLSNVIYEKTEAEDGEHVKFEGIHIYTHI
jgi:hypothetical protein